MRSSAVRVERRARQEADRARARLAADRLRSILYGAFVLSGFSGLIYESIWTHYLKLLLGHAAYAQSLVLAIFMGGMAFGAWAASRWSGRWTNLLRAYAVVEAAIGVLALVFHPTFTASVDLALSVVLPRLGPTWAATGFKWTLSSLLIAPQSILLGMTFPLMTSAVLRRFPEARGQSIATLYFANSIGAAVGVLASGFLLIGALGLPGTIAVAGGLNIVVAAVVWRLAGAGPSPIPSTPERPEPAVAANGLAPRRRLLAPLLLVSAGTGASSFMYEVGWNRMLGLVFGSSTHSFELMLSAFILGLALGGLFIRGAIDGLTRPLRILGLVQVAMGALALWTLMVYGTTFDIMNWLVGALSKTDAGYRMFLFASSAIAGAIMLPATFCAGMTLPLITDALLRDGHGEASIGYVYSANTLGAIAGVFVAVHFGLPVLGLKGLITLGAAIDLALGVALLFSAAADLPQRWRLAAVAAAALVVVVVPLVARLDPGRMASGIFRRGKIVDGINEHMVFHEDGKTATVSLVGDRWGHLRIATNGKTDAAVTMIPTVPHNADEATMTLAAVLPMAMRPQARTAATIGLGCGLTTQTLLSNPRLERVDTIEIEQKIVEAAAHFRPRVERVYTDPRSHIVIDDAKSFFAAQGRRYDMIVSEPSNPWVSGVSNLFSVEFYHLIRRHLTEDGLFVQWFQLYEIDFDLLLSVLKAVDSSFDDYVIFNGRDFDVLIIAQPRGRLGTIDRRLLEIPEIREELRRVDIKTAQDLELRRVASRRILHRFVQAAPGRPNSDYFPVLDQGAARARFVEASAAHLSDFARSPIPALALLDGQAGEGALPPTEVSPAASFGPARQASTAVALRDFLLRGVPPPPAAVVSISPEAMEWVQSPAPDCAQLQRQPAVLAGLIDLTASLIPFLTPAEMAAIERRLGTDRCAASLPPSQQRWLELLSALGARDGERMAALAEATLSTRDGRAGPEAVWFALTAGMVGHLMRGETAAARRLWEQHGSAVGSLAPGPELLLRVLAAESVAQL